MSSKTYRSVFFDLDNTLWDFTLNSHAAFGILYEKYGFEKRGISLEDLLEVYHHYNDLMWEEYRQGRIAKDELRWQRFFLTLQELGHPDEDLARKMDEEYINTSRQMTGLVEGATEILAYLKKKYRLYLLTNGFNEVQFMKIRNSGLEPYFKKVITSEMAGALKPHPRFFDYALQQTGSLSGDSIMIGDDPEADIRGAHAAGIDTVLFDPRGKTRNTYATFKIRKLKELKGIL